MVEYLLLLATVFLITYLTMTVGPLKDNTNQIIENLKGSVQSVVKYGESRPVTEGSSDNPASPERLKPLHL